MNIMVPSNENKLALSMGVLCFQGFGIRIFEGVMDGAIVFWLLVLVLLNFKSLRRTTLKYWLKMVGIVMAYFVFCLIKGVPVLPYIIVAWFSSAVVLTPYYLGQANFVNVMRRLTRFCMYYSLCHVPIILLFKDNLITTSFGMHPKTFLYLFYFNGVDNGFAGMPRIQGFCWEPSCWNLLLDLNLVFALYFKERLSVIIASLFAIITIMSTTGLMVMLVIVGIYYMMNMRLKRILQTSVALCIFALLIGPIIYGNLRDILNSGSGNARIGDFAIALAVIEKHPLLGIDIDDLTHSALAMQARERAWTATGDKVGYMEQGMVNSFAALIVEWGVPIVLIIFWLMFKTPLLPEKKLKMLYLFAVLCVLMGTPIARTGFFYLYAFSTILLPNMNRKKKYVIRWK